jgi:hypothetical protein
MKGTNFLANIFDWFGEVFERLSPAMFRMLSTVLPYITPLPVAWLTAHSATEFLGFPPAISVVFVVMLEGLGLWATTELVDAFVEAVRSPNWKSWGVVAFLVMVVGAYVSLLINLNVTLEKATGNNNPVYSYILTLICFLPMIAGSLNGYRKVKLERKTEMQIAKENQDARDAQIRQENMDFKLKKAALKAGHNIFAPQPVQTLALDTPQVQVKEAKEKHASDMKDKIRNKLDAKWKASKVVWGAADLCKEIGLDPATERSEVWRQIQAWKQENGVS